MTYMITAKVNMLKNSTRDMNMTEGPVFGKIIIYSLPLIATGLLQLLFNVSDSIVVSNFAPNGTASLAAVGSCGALINLIVNLFMGLSLGAGVSVSQYYGAKQFDEVKKTLHTAIPAAAILGIVVGVFGFLSAETLLIWTGVEGDILDEATLYMRAYMVGMPASMVYNYCASMLRATGDTQHSMIFLTIAGVINVILNLFVVIVLGLGAVGVGITSTIANWLSLIMILVFLIRKGEALRFEPKQMRIWWDKLWLIVRIGIPAGLQGCVFSLSNVVIQSAVNGFGEVVMAGNTAASHLGNLIYTAMNSLYHATLNFVGQNVGAGKLHRIKKIVLECSLIVLAIGLILGAFSLICGRQLLGIFTKDNQDVIDAGMIKVIYVCGTYFLCGIMEVGCGAMRGMGSSFIPMVASVVGTCVVRIGWVYTIFALFPTLEVLYLSYPISWLLTAAAHYISCIILYRHLKKKRALAGEEIPAEKILSKVDCG